MQQAFEIGIRATPGRDRDDEGVAAAPVDSDGPVISVSAMGDLMQCGEWRQVTQDGALGSALGALAQEVQDDDLVFANLETACPGDDGVIDKEPLVLAEAEEILQCLRLLGVDVVNVANNHAFDAFFSGFDRLRRRLDEAGVGHLGAGEDLATAGRPLIVQRRGIRLGWLAYADASCRPSHVASAETYGVQPFGLERALAAVESLRPQVDHVIVSLHWGIEYCQIPSPQQVVAARRLVDAGARLILGHHVHVVQGVERHGDGVIAYNLGNVTTSDHHVGGRLAIHQTPRTRSSLVLRAQFNRRSLLAVELIPIRSRVGRVLLDDPKARRYLEYANRKLAAGISEGQWRRRRLYEDVLLRTARKLHPKVIRSIRPKHLSTFAKNVVGALSGRGPSA